MHPAAISACRTGVRLIINGAVMASGAARTAAGTRDIIESTKSLWLLVFVCSGVCFVRKRDKDVEGGPFQRRLDE